MRLVIRCVWLPGCCYAVACFQCVVGSWHGVAMQLLICCG